MNAAGGTGDYTFTLNDGGATTNVTQAGGTYTFTGLGAGNYDIDVEDANGCAIPQINTSLTQPADELTATTTNISDFGTFGLSCNGATDGFIEVTAAGGTANYTFTLDDGTTTVSQTQPGTTYTFNNLAAGSYTIDVEDVNGCTIASINETLTQPDAFTASAAVSSNYNGADVSCVGSSDGSISTAITSGGTGTLTYDLEDGNGNALGDTSGDTDGNYTGLAAGTYQIRITDNNGCTTLTNEVILSDPTQLTASTTLSDYNGTNISLQWSG